MVTNTKKASKYGCKECVYWEECGNEMFCKYSNDFSGCANYEEYVKGFENDEHEEDC